MERILAWRGWEDLLKISEVSFTEKVVVACVTIAAVLLWTLPLSWWSRNEEAVTYTVDVPVQLKSKYTWRPANYRVTFEEVRDGKIYPRCPADGRILEGQPIIPATQRQVDLAIAAATSAQQTWASTTFSERRRVLKTLLQYILDHQEEIVAACCLDSGKTKIDASFGEILVTTEKLQWTIKHGEKSLAPSRRPTNLLMSYKKNTVIYEPLGVVAACVSWNYPFHNLISPTISALFAGNAIVVKPSEQTCWSSLYFTDIIKGALSACGHSPDLLQNTICLPDVADYLTSHPGLSHITFIGSREIAHKVAASAAASLTGLTIELGGKDPAIILDDNKTIANLEDIASTLMRGVFQSAGQNCIGIERVIALPKIHDRLLKKVAHKIRNLRLGSVLLMPDAPDMGAMISSRSFDKLESLIQSAVRDGAILHCGGSRYAHPEYPNGHYFQPTLLSDVTATMDIARTELFAPVFLLMRANTVDEAIALANSADYALGSSVFGHNRTDTQKCVNGIAAGMVAVNDFAAYYACSMPFGGRGGSGYGRFGGQEGLIALCNIKSVCEDALWARLLGICTRIPGPLRYPVQGERGWTVCMGVVETGYAIGIKPWFRGIVKLLVGLAGVDLNDKKKKAKAAAQEEETPKPEENDVPKKARKASTDGKAKRKA